MGLCGGIGVGEAVGEDLGDDGPRGPVRRLEGDLYAHPTFYDPCSLVVLEAMASGLPVVTSSHDGAGELIGLAEGRGVTAGTG